MVNIIGIDAFFALVVGITELAGLLAHTLQNTSVSGLVNEVSIRTIIKANFILGIVNIRCLACNTL